MAVTVTPNMTTISMCESTTGWTGAGGTNSDFANEGTYCLGVQVKNTTGGTIYYTPGSPLNLSSGQHIYFWVLITGLPDTKANGGIRLYLYTDASNYSYFYVGGSDNYSGGWKCFVLDPAATRNTGAGTLNTASIARIGIQFKTVTTIAGTTYNCFWDAVRYGTGLTITSGATDAIDLADIYAVDNSSSYKYGVLQKEATGSYYINGKLTFGDSASTGSVDFTDTNQIILFPDNDYVSTSFYGIDVVGNSTGTTNFTLGAKSGTAGINGCVVKAVGTRTYTLTASDTDNDKVLLYGTTFQNAGVITLPVTATNREVLNCNFVAGDGVTASTCVVENCNFIAGDDEALLLSSTSHNVTDCNFIGNPNAVRINTAGTYTFDNLKFTSNTTDIDNTSGGAVIVNCSNGSNPSTETNDTTIVNTVTLTVQGVTTGNEPTTYVRCRIQKASDGTELMSEEAQTSYGSEGYYKATQDYAYPGSDVDVIVRARYKGYLPFETNATITSAGLTITAVWIADANYQL